MTKSTRYFLGSSLAVLGAGLGVGLLAYYTGGFQALSASTGPSELAYVPADAAVVAYADVGAIMSSELRQRIRQAVPEQDKGQAEFEQQTGIDIERDIQYVVAAMSPGSGHSGLIVARGNFNPVQLESLAVEHGGSAETYRDRRLISKTAVHGPDGGGTLAFLEPGLVAIGDTATVKRAIDARMNATSVTDNGDIMALVSQIERGHNAWAVGRFDALASQGRVPDQLTQQLPPVSWFAAAGQINGGVTGLVRVEATDDEGADLLRRQVNGALAFGEMMSRSDVRAAAALKSIQVSGSGRTVQLSFQVPGEVLDIVMPHAGTAIEPQH